MIIATETNSRVVITGSDSNISVYVDDANVDAKRVEQMAKNAIDATTTCEAAVKELVHRLHLVGLNFKFAWR